MSRPGRVPGDDPLEPPFPEERAPGTVVERVDLMAADDEGLDGSEDRLDEGEEELPTGEHGPAELLELSNSDLLTDDGAADRAAAYDEGADEDELDAHPAYLRGAGLHALEADTPIESEPVVSSLGVPEEDEEDAGPEDDQPDLDPPGLPRSPSRPEVVPLGVRARLADGGHALAGETLPPRRIAARAERELPPEDEPEGDTDTGPDSQGDPDAELEALPTRIEREQDVDGMPGSNAPRLVIIGGNNRGKEFELKRGDNSIGRGVDNDVVLADIAVSRKHTLVCFEGGQFVLRDLGSGNGTLVNSQRVDSMVLQDGDQLELGNTLLRFVSPLLSPSLNRQPTAVTGRSASVSHASSAKRLPAAPSPSPPPSSTSRLAPSLLSRRPVRLALFGTVAVIGLLGISLGVKALVSRKHPGVVVTPGPKPDEIVAQEYSKGIEEFNARNWEAAQKHFMRVLALAPNQGQVRQGVERAQAEMIARDALASARQKLKAKDYVGARAETAKVKADSTYSADAEALGKTILEQQLSSLVEAARALRDQGDSTRALEKVREAQGIAPKDESVSALYAELTGAPGKKGGHPQRPTPQRPAPQRPAPQRPTPKAPSQPEVVAKLASGGQGKAAMAFYKKRQWEQANQAMAVYVESQKGKKQKPARALADAMRTVGQSWTKADRSANTNPALGLRLYQEALAADLRVERGSHQKTLKDLIVKAARTQGAMALAKKKYREAYAVVKIAEANGGRGDPGVQKLLQALQKRAEELFAQGYSLRSSNLPQARKLWQEILGMVPSSSEIYKKAYSWINNSNPTYTDEDEE